MDESNADTISTNSLKPSKASSDGQSVEQVPIQDQIAADRYALSKSATRKTGGIGIVMKKIIPPGAS